MDKLTRLLAAAGPWRLVIARLVARARLVRLETGADYILVGDSNCRLAVRYQHGEPHEYLMHTPPETVAA